MQGHNKLELNGATIQEAMQEWLDRRWNASVGPCPEVTDVRAETIQGVPTFTVHLTERDDD